MKKDVLKDAFYVDLIVTIVICNKTTPIFLIYKDGKKFKYVFFKKY
jgi:hypothetical protein